MSRNAPQISVLTANRLDDGVVVFLDGEGGWSEDIGMALPARTPEEARTLEARGAHDAARNLIVEPYLVEVSEAVGGLTPLRTRERVRIQGPSILADVPGYVAPTSPSPRASPPFPCTPSARGEGWGEGQSLAPAPVYVAAPHPNPLPASPRAQSGSLAQVDGPRASGEREFLRATEAA
jgi:hypothetical protein